METVMWSPCDKFVAILCCDLVNVIKITIATNAPWSCDDIFTQKHPHFGMSGTFRERSDWYTSFTESAWLFYLTDCRRRNLHVETSTAYHGHYLVVRASIAPIGGPNTVVRFYGPSLLLHLFLYSTVLSRIMKSIAIWQRTMPHQPLPRPESGHLSDQANLLLFFFFRNTL